MPLVADVLTDGWQDAVAARASTYVSERTWRRVLRGRARRRCAALATTARAILQGKTTMHDLVGRSAGSLLGLLGAGAVEQQLARELVRRIPLPPDAKLTAAARGVQVTGVLLCLSRGEELARCECFVDLALAETKEHVKALLLAAVDDWTGLAVGPLDHAHRPRPSR